MSYGRAQGSSFAYIAEGIDNALAIGGDIANDLEAKLASGDKARPIVGRSTAGASLRAGEAIASP